jgi:hypothetical protein
MNHMMSYWRSLAGLMATTQAEFADVVDTSLQEMAELADNSTSQDSPMGQASLPMALYAATGAGMLTTAQAMCRQIGQSARQFTANNGGDPVFGLAPSSNEEDSGSTRTRNNQRKAA